MTLFALVAPVEFFFLPPVCLAIALVTAAAHRDDVREITRYALRSWIVLVGGILAFLGTVSYVFEWVLP